jgi:hypothetical protein
MIKEVSFRNEERWCCGETGQTNTQFLRKIR